MSNVQYDFINIFESAICMIKYMNLINDIEYVLNQIITHSSMKKQDVSNVSVIIDTVDKKIQSLIG